MPAGIKEHGSQGSGIMSTTSREAYFSLKRNAAPGVEDLAGAMHEAEAGAYRAKPVRRVYIPKAERGLAAQRVEARIGCKILNTMTALVEHRIAGSG